MDLSIISWTYWYNFQDLKLLGKSFELPLYKKYNPSPVFRGLASSLHRSELKCRPLSYEAYQPL